MVKQNSLIFLAILLVFYLNIKSIYLEKSDKDEVRFLNWKPRSTSNMPKITSKQSWAILKIFSYH